MEDLIGQILAFILSLAFDFLLEVLGAALEDLAGRALSETLQFPRIENPSLAAAGYVMLGAMIGGMSVLLFPHPFFRPSRFHGVSLIISPLLTGAFMSMIGSYMERRGRESVRIESFGYGAVFAFGMAAVRFWFARP